MYARQPIQMSEAEYLAFEDESDLKHEYREGVLYAMSGGTLRHNVITMNIGTQLNIQLADCVVTSPDTRVHIATRTAYRYPDVTVFCGRPIFVPGCEDTITNPAILVEVLSPSSESRDLNIKLDEYTQIDSLQAYLIVSQDTIRVDRYLRDESGQWVYQSFIGAESKVTVPSLGVSLELADIYRKLNWDDYAP